MTTYKKLNHKHKCVICNKIYYRYRKITKYCSRECFNKSERWNKNLTKYTDERVAKYAKKLINHKCYKSKIRNKNISKSLIGKKTWLGKKHKPETKIKISLKQSGEKIFTGFKKSERHRHMNSPEYINWRNSVFKRDNYTCQDCGKTNCYIEAHHKKSYAKYPNLRLQINNGITYCKKCHIKHDEIRGKFKDGNI